MLAKKIKIVLFAIFLGFMVLILFQNADFFQYKSNLSANIFFGEFQTPDIPIFAYFVSFFVFGFVWSSYFTWMLHSRTKKQIKAYHDEIERLKAELAEAGTRPTFESEARPFDDDIDPVIDVDQTDNGEFHSSMADEAEKSTSQKKE
ncbi:hypothetical protein GMMP15_190030 [Candidatus Magnetomoraceae bacterium gMMP-15]